MYEPPNRGSKTWAALGRLPGGNDPGSITDPTALAKAFLMPRGYTIVWSGWDKSAGISTANFNLTITLPVATNPDGSSITGPAFEYIVSPGSSCALNYPAATLDQSQSELTHRIHLDDVPQIVPASDWNYNATGTAISLTTGDFVANDIYEFADDGCESAGQYIPFARTADERLASGDPRPSVEERYPSFRKYSRAVIRAIDDLIEDRLMLCEDAADQQARLFQAGLDAGVPPPRGPLSPQPPVPHCRGASRWQRWN